MTDPWYIGAQQHRQQQEDQARQATEHKRLQDAELRTALLAAEATRQEMEQAIAAAVPLLTRFLHERGPAAQALLGAYSENGGYVVFGDDARGGDYFSVYLNKDGLRREVGIKSGYDCIPKTSRPASPKEAVEAFAYHGPGHHDPRQVHNIVDWLTERIDGHLPQ